MIHLWKQYCSLWYYVCSKNTKIDLGRIKTKSIWGRRGIGVEVLRSLKPICDVSSLQKEKEGYCKLFFITFCCKWALDISFSILFSWQSVFLLLSECITFIVVQWLSQSNFLGFPSFFLNLMRIISLSESTWFVALFVDLGTFGTQFLLRFSRYPWNSVLKIL